MGLGSLKFVVLACSLQVAHPITAEQAAIWNAQHPTVIISPKPGDSCAVPTKKEKHHVRRP